MAFAVTDNLETLRKHLPAEQAIVDIMELATKSRKELGFEDVVITEDGVEYESVKCLAPILLQRLWEVNAPVMLIPQEDVFRFRRQ